jgi:dihydroorotase-like cyclic amidohydrolase
MLSLVARGDLSLTDMVRICCEGPAQIFGLYPRKGCIAIGADADVVILDPSKGTTVADSDQLSRANHTPYNGLRVPFAIDRVFLRGELISEGGRIAREPRGTFVRR